MRGILAQIVAAAFAALAWLPHAAAGDAATLSDLEVGRRIAFIEERLDASRRHAQIWYWSWLAVNAGGALGLAAAAALTDDGDARASFIPQAVLAALGVADLTVIRPLDARLGADPIRSLPEGTRALRLAKLERAQALFCGNAARAESRTSLLLHLANLGLNGAAGLATWATGKSSDALVSFASGLAGGELYIWSEPGAPAQDWQDYQRRATEGSAAASPRWSVVPGFGRIALRLEW